jgi:hypothetical protein
MPKDLSASVVIALGEWIRLLEHPDCQVRDSVFDLKKRQTRIAGDSSRIKEELMDGNIWGGMGSRIDCAQLHTRLPTSSVPSERAAQWGSAIDEVDAWNRKFYGATVTLGTALLEWCSAHSALESYQRKMIESWIDIFTAWLVLPHEPLKPENIECLESNLQFVDTNPSTYRRRSRD